MYQPRKENSQCLTVKKSNYDSDEENYKRNNLYFHKIQYLYYHTLISRYGKIKQITLLYNTLLPTSLNIRLFLDIAIEGYLQSENIFIGIDYCTIMAQLHKLVASHIPNLNSDLTFNTYQTQ